MNKILINELITRQIDLLRYEKTVRNDVFALLDFMQSNIQTQLFSGSLNAQIEHIENIIKNGYASILKILDVLPVLDTEMMWLAATLGGLAAAYKLKDKIIPFAQKKLKDLAEKFTVGGLTLPESLAKQQNDLTAKIKAWLRQAKIDDITPDLSELGDLFSHAKNTAKTMTRTWINSVAHTAHDAFAKINPMIKGFRHLSVLDGTTTAVCTHRNGLLWDKKRNPIGHNEAFKRPPLHYNCRSKLVYVHDLKEPFNGYSGEDWIKSRSLSQLQEQFGKGIGQMLFDGKIQLSDALDGVKQLTLQALQLKQLREQFGTTLTDSVLMNSLVQPVLREMIFRLPEIKQTAKQYHLSDTDYTALFLYSRLGQTINRVQYNRQFGSAEIRAVFDEINTAINHALAKLPNYAGVVIRFSHLPNDFLDLHQIGQVVHYDNLVSASLLEVKLSSHENNQLIIFSKSGKLIENWSALPHQHEVLFRAGTRFKVLDKQQYGQMTYLWLEEIDDEK